MFFILAMFFYFKKHECFKINWSHSESESDAE